MRENTLVSSRVIGASRLMEEMKRTDLAPFRSKAVVRMLEQVAKDEELALRRATELTQEFTDQTLAMFQQAKDPGAGIG